MQAVEAWAWHSHKQQRHVSLPHQPGDRLQRSQPIKTAARQPDRSEAWNPGGLIRSVVEFYLFSFCVFSLRDPKSRDRIVSRVFLLFECPSSSTRSSRSAAVGQAASPNQRHNDALVESSLFSRAGSLLRGLCSTSDLERAFPEICVARATDRKSGGETFGQFNCMACGPELALPRPTTAQFPISNFPRRVCGRRAFTTGSTAVRNRPPVMPIQVSRWLGR